MRHKIGTKLTIYIALVVIITFSVSIMISQFVLPRYYIHQMNQEINHAFTIYQESGDEKLAELQYDVMILSVPLNKKINGLNEDLKHQLAKEHIALNKFWVSNEVLQKVAAGKKVGILYDQGKQKSSFIAHYAKVDDQLVMIGTSIADFNSISKFINRFNLAFILFSILVIMFITGILSRKLTKPLIELKKVAKEIGDLDFKQVDIRTGDEIEELAGSINKMSQALETAQRTLSKRNLDLKQFMIGLTHEVKTPLSLIKVYASGIEDGMDDGTYITTIQKQVDQMEKIISDMLYFAKMEKSDSEKTRFDLIKLLKEILHDYQYVNDNKQIRFVTEINEYFLTAEQEKVQFIFGNLLSNAVKYAISAEIEVYFHQDGVLAISNKTTLKEITNIWQPFYVAEGSRNKNFSGTGLGLTTVKNLAEQAGYAASAELSNGKITFKIGFRHFPVTKPN